MKTSLSDEDDKFWLITEIKTMNWKEISCKFDEANSNVDENMIFWNYALCKHQYKMSWRQRK